jgi:hypothetical protein
MIFIFKLASAELAWKVPWFAQMKIVPKLFQKRMDFSKIISYKPCSASFSSQQIARGGMEVCRKKRDAPTLSFNRIFKSFLNVKILRGLSLITMTSWFTNDGRKKVLLH